MSSTLSRPNSPIIWTFCSPTADTLIAPKQPKEQNQNYFSQLHLEHILCSHDSLPNDWPSPEHTSNPLHHCNRGKTDLSTGTHRWKGIGTTGKNLLAINNQHSDIVLALFLQGHKTETKDVWKFFYIKKMLVLQQECTFLGSNLGWGLLPQAAHSCREPAV